MSGRDLTESDERCSACRGDGGWQQADGLIIECPNGCMTRSTERQRMAEVIGQHLPIRDGGDSYGCTGPNCQYVEWEPWHVAGEVLGSQLPTDTQALRQVRKVVDELATTPVPPDAVLYALDVLGRLRAALGEDQPPAPCGAYSNGTDGWCCAATGPHDEHHNAAGDVRWGDA